MAEHGPTEELQLHVRTLQRSLAAVTKERDDLAKDVEQLCLVRGGHMFSSSYVASERLRFLESELKQQRLLLRNVTLERDNLQEDMWQIRLAKKQSDEGWQKERRQTAALQKDLDFYKASSAQAIAERDSLAFEAQSCKDNLAAATAALQDTKAQLSLVQQLSTDLQGQLASVKQQLETEQREAASCRVQLKQQKQQYEQQLQQMRDKQVQQEQRMQQQGQELKAVQDELSSSKATAAELRSQVARLQSSASDLQHQLDSAKAAAEGSKAQVAQLKTANANLHKQLNTSTVAVQDLQTLLEQTSAALVASQARLIETHAATAAAATAGATPSSSPTRSAELQQEIKGLKAQLAEAEDQLQQAARDKLQVQLELSQAQAGEDEYAHTLIQLQQLYHHCKELLATATQQKVEALLQIANQEAKALAEQPAQQTISTQQQQQQGARVTGVAGSPVLASSPVSTPPQKSNMATAAGGSASSSLSNASAAGTAVLAPHRAGHLPMCSTDPEHPHQAGVGASLAPAGEQRQQQQQQQQAHEQDLHPLPVVVASDGSTMDMKDTMQRNQTKQQQQQQQQQQELALQHVQQVSHGLHQLLQLTHHYVTLLQQLPPSAVAAAATSSADNTGSGSKGRSTGRKGSSPTPAAAASGGGGSVDVLAQLAAAAHDLDKDRQQLLSSSHLKQQQLEQLLSQLLQPATTQNAAAAAEQAAAPTAGAAVEAPVGSKAPSAHSGGALAGLGKLLKAHGAPTRTATAAGAPAAASAGHPEGHVQTLDLISSICAAVSNSSSSSSGDGGGGCGPNKPGHSQHAVPTGRGSAAASPAAGIPATDSVTATNTTDMTVTSTMAVVDSAGDVVRGVSDLQLALCHEVQQLADCGLNALRYIPKLTALSSLMQGAW